MPNAAPKVCATAGCPKHAEPSKLRCRECEQAREQEKAARNAKYGAIYDTARWKRIRRAHLLREPMCRHCYAQHRITAATDVDHVDGNAENMQSHNLQSLCKACHARKTVAEQGALRVDWRD